MDKEEWINEMTKGWPAEVKNHPLMKQHVSVHAEFLEGLKVTLDNATQLIDTQESQVKQLKEILILCGGAFEQVSELLEGIIALSDDPDVINPLNEGRTAVINLSKKILVLEGL